MERWYRERRDQNAIEDREGSFSKGDSLELVQWIPSDLQYQGSNLGGEREDAPHRNSTMAGLGLETEGQQ